MKNLRSLLFVVLSVVVGMHTAQAQLMAAESQTGNLYQVSTATGSLSFIAATGLTGLSDIAFAPDGTLYGFTNALSFSPSLYAINPLTGATTLRGAFGVGTVFEGGLAILSNAVAFVANGNDSASAELLRVNLQTGQATVVGVLSGGSRDINGLAFRADGTLVGLDRVSNALVTIDTNTAAVSFLASVPSTVGAVGGLTLRGNLGYYSTGGSGGINPGSNTLYSFNAVTGASSALGVFSGATLGIGITGLALAPVPEPRQRMDGGGWSCDLRAAHGNSEAAGICVIGRAQTFQQNPLARPSTVESRCR